MKQFMKRLLTFALVVFSILSASAQYGQSVLNLRLSDNGPFRATIDGRPVSTAVGSNATIANLEGGKHFLQVYRVGNNWGHHHQDNAFQGTILLSANAESWVTVYPEMQKVKFDNIQALAQPSPFNPNKIDCNYPKGPLQGEYEHHEEHHEDHHYDHHEGNYFPPVPVGPCAMNPNDFAQLKQTIANASFEETRITIFKQALAYNYFSTSQVRELMDQFWFEGSKLEVAKLAYPKTVDQNNYYLVNNEFSFSSSVDDLGNYIAMK